MKRFPYPDLDLSRDRKESMEDWKFSVCEKAPKTATKHLSRRMYSNDWANVVPGLIEKLVAEIADKKKLELRFNLLEILTKQLKSKIGALESSQTKIVPINTFAPEPYELSKPFLVAVQSTEGGYEAGWYDVNIYTSGENEEEAVANLKSLILDFFDSLSKEAAEKLGIEPKRQLEILKTFIKRTH
jgi:hypothetical protein